MKEAVRLLEIVTTRFPPAPGCAHALGLHEGKPCLTLMLPKQWQRVGLDASDLERTPEAIVEDISTYLRSLCGP